MHSWISNTCEFLLLRWQSATLQDYGALVLFVAVIGWLITRRQPA